MADDIDEQRVGATPGGELTIEQVDGEVDRIPFDDSVGHRNHDVGDLTFVED